MTLNERISQILGVSIQQNQWRKYLELLDRQGAVTKKIQLDMIVALCEKFTELEDKLAQNEPKTVKKDNL